MATDKVFTVRGFEAERRSIPLPIQTYFWRQTSQLLKRKLAKRTYESACVSFERMICDNRIQDLQTRLASAVNSIPRWHFIQSSVPYILQCSSALLGSRTKLGNIERLGNAEKSLLYTLHWILVEAPSACSVTEQESLLFPLTTIEQFVHLLAPHVHTVRQDDLTFRLENGYSLWQALWHHVTPPFTPFTTPVIHKDDINDEINESHSYRSSRNSAVVNDESEDFSAATFFDVAVLKCLCSPGWSEEGVVWGLFYLADYLQREFQLPVNESQKEVEKITFKVECHDSSSESLAENRPEEVRHKVSKEPSGNREEAFGADKERKRQLELQVDMQKTPGMSQEAGESGGLLSPYALERTPSGTKLRIRVQPSPVLANSGCVFAAVASRPDKSDATQQGQREGKALSDSAVIFNTNVTIRPTTPEDESKQKTRSGEFNQSPEAPDVITPSSCRSHVAAANPAAGDVKGQVLSGELEGISTASSPLSSKPTKTKNVTIKTDPASPNRSTTSGIRTGGENVSSAQVVAQFHDNKDGRDVPSSTNASSLNQIGPVATSAGSNRGSFVRTERYRVYPGAAEYITNDGRLSTLVILQALNGIVTEHPTSQVCDAVLRVFHCLVKIDDKYKSKKRDSVFGVDDRTVAETQAIGFRSPHSDNVLGRLRASFYGRPPSFLSVSLGCTFSLIKALGCPLGCGEGCRGVTGEKLRKQTNQLLSQLLKEDEVITSWLLQYARLEPVENQVDFLHALLGFCEDVQDFSDDEGEREKPKGTLFNVPDGVEGRIVRGLFHTLVTRVSEINYEDLKNLTFYGEIRQLLKYIKENFGGVFWEVALRGLLDSICKEPIKSDQPQSSARNVETSQSVTSLRRVSSSAKDDRTLTPKSKRMFLFQKIGRGTGAAEMEPVTAALPSSGPGTERTMSPRSKRKIFTLSSWRKQKTVGTPYNSDDENLDLVDVSADTTPVGSRRKSQKQKTSGRKKIEDVFPIKIPHNVREHDVYLEPVDVQRKPVDVDGLRAGMFRFSFLLNGSQPGSIPDPKIVASMLDLDAPVVSRACLLLECAHLVHKCNKREWPRWLRGSLPYLPGSKKSQSIKGNNFMFTHRKNLVAMHEAGKLFHAWGVALGLKLQQLMKKESILLPEEDDGNWKSQLKGFADEEAVEDFLDEATLKESCPYALKMVACQLLLEITAFLCESHVQISFGKETTRAFQPRVLNRKRQNSGSRRRSFAPDRSSRFSGYFGGGAERIRKASIMSQTSALVDFNNPGARRSIHGPPVITVSGDNAERKGDGLLGPQTPSGLFVNRVGLHQRRPSKKQSAVGGEGESLRHRTKRGVRGNRFSAVDPMNDTDEDSDDEWISKFPWLQAVVQLNSVTRFVCDHQGRCPASCYRRQSCGCSRLTRALKVVYADAPEKRDKSERSKGDQGTVSGGSPLISSPQYAGLPSVEQKSQKDKPNEEMLRYIDTKVSGLTHCPLSVIAKAGVVIDTMLLEETLPISWQLLLNDDQQLVSAAAAVFLLTGVRLRSTVERMLHTELTCPDADDRMMSLLRYEVLWHSRYHAWPRLKDGARQDLKVPPPKVDFTLPSPAVGIPTEQAPDCPWNPFLMLEEQQSLKEKESKKVKTIRDEERARQLRSEFLLRTVPVSLDATAGVSTGDEENAGETPPVDAELWPPAVSSAVPDIIRMMDDVLVDSNRTAVMEAAARVVWTCLVNDPVLFFRIILEQLTKKDKQEELIALLRKLLLFVIQLPPTSSRFLVNNLIGVAMFYARTNKPGTQDSVALVLSLLWELVPSVRGFYFKDLKQCLKKEFIDAAFRVSANVPGAKRLAVTSSGQENTLERVPVHEEMTFGKVLSYYKARISLHDTDLYLIDKRSNQILEERLYVRDMFQYRKGFPSPQLLLERLEYDKAFSRRQDQAFTTKLSDIGRILLTTSILKAQPSQKHVSLLHDEFSRQISFPRKALDCDFELYTGGTKGKELAALNVIHKGYWVKMICLLFDCMPSDFPWGKAELHLFLNVLNGAVLLHCEDTAMLRLCLASFINVAIHFSHIFSTDGYQCIFPSLLQVYSHHQSNGMVTAAIEFTLSQLYTLHQKPCLLQLLASVAPKLLLENKQTNEEEQTANQDNKIPPKCLFSLLVSLDKPMNDVLEILELVKAEKPLKPVDSCYENTVETGGDSKVDEVIRLCVTVVNFAPESKRAVQMVVVLSAILPHYVDYLKCDSSGVGSLSEDKMKKELAALTSLATSVQVLVKSCEVLTRSFVHFQSYKSMSDKNEILPDLASTTASIGPYLGRESFGSIDGGDDTDEMRNRPLLERIRAQEEKDEVMEALEQFRNPRDALLLLVSEYVRLCSPRVQELRRILPPRLSAPELLDGVCIMTVAEIAYALLKLAVYDAVTLASPGVHRYIVEALPVMEGPSDALNSSMLLILKRAQKIFQKLVSKPSLARFVDWKSLEVFLDGLHMLLCKQTSIAFSQHLKSIVTECMCLVLEERPTTATSVVASLPFAPFFTPPQSFCDMVIKLASRVMFELRAECSLKELCGGIANFGSPARTEKVFTRVLLPILIRLGSGRQGAPKASPDDIAFALTCFLQIVTTESTCSSTSGPVRLSLADDDLDLTRLLAFVRPHIGGTSTEEIPEVVYHLAYLGIKLLMVCFEDLLSNEWYRIYQALEMVAETAICGVAFWDFLHFTVSHRTPLFLILMPVISTKIIHVPHTNNTERALKQRILGKLHRPPPVISCRNVHIRRFLEGIAALKQKRKATEEEEDLEGEERGKGLVLKSPPPGKNVADAPDSDSKLISKLRRVGSHKPKKAVSFIPSTDLAQADSKLSESSDHGAKRHPLRKQESFETVDEQEQPPGDNTGDADSSDSRFSSQRGVTLKGKNPFRKGSHGKRPGLSRFKAVAAHVMMKERERERSGSNVASDAINSVDAEDAETKDLIVDLTDIVVDKVSAVNSNSTSKDNGPTQKAGNGTSKDDGRTQKPGNGTSKDNGSTQKAGNGTSQDNGPTQQAGNGASKDTGPTQKAYKTSIHNAPIATPESLSPANSLEGRVDSPIDVLESLRPVPPGSPLKTAEFFGETNGSLTSKLTPPCSQERATRLSRTRKWHRVYTDSDPSTENAMPFVCLAPEQEIKTTSSGGFQTQQTDPASENQRETNV